MGLVDEVAGLWQAGRSIHKDLKLKGKFALRFMKPQRKRFSLSELMQDTEDTLSTIRGKLETKTVPSYLFQLGK
jgi:protease-4